MKKTRTQLAILILFLVSIMTVQSQNCTVPFGTSDLTGNNVKAGLLIGGDLWWDGSNARYIVPTVEPGSGLPEVSAIFAGGIWMGGYDASGNLKLAAQQYGTASGNTDYFAGPLNDDGTTTSTQCSNFDRFWIVTDDEINTHNADYADNGTIDNPIDAVMGWPGRGNPNFESINGFELPFYNHSMAPFVDLNANGIFEPAAGDYPNINGASQGNWFVFNDAGGTHTSSDGDALGMQTQVLAYSYVSSEEAINNATFYDYYFAYKGAEVLEDSYMSLWVDADLGCYLDDYIGCVPEANLAYVYNQDATDGEPGCTCPGGVQTYCDDVPLVGIKMLDGIYAERIIGQGGELEVPTPGQAADTIVSLGMSSFIYFNGVGATQGTADPATPAQYFNYMQGLFQDGLPLTTGGLGHNPGSTDYTNYAFPGNPSDGSEWSMCSEALPAGDRRMLINSGPFRLSPGSINRLSFAVIYQPSVAYPCPDVGGLVEVGDIVSGFYNDNSTVSTKTPVYQDNAISLTPNPFTNQTQLLIDGQSNLQQVQLYSITGQLVRSYNSLSAKSLTIQKGNLTSGMYLYRALTEDGKAYSGKLVVE